MKKDIVVAGQAFDSAVEDAVITVESASIIDVNDNVLAGMNGMDIDDIEVSEVTLVTVLVNDSSSIEYGGLTDAFIEGQNELIDALANSKASDSIMFAQGQFNYGVLHSYVPIEDAERLNSSNFRPSGMTPLYNHYIEALGANIAYAQMLKENGTPVKNIFIVITDGADVNSSKRDIDCNTLTKDLLMSEQFVIGFIGAGNEADFRQVAKDMGIPDKSILEVDASSKAIRDAFNLASKSAIKASQGIIDPNA